jgi:hypothetical protein
MVTHLRESRQFESIYTLQGEPDTHDMYAPVPIHVWHMYASCGQSPYMITFHAVINNIGQSHYSKKRSESTAYRLINPWIHTQFLFYNNHWSSGSKAKHLLTTDYIDLLGPYLHHIISTFNTSSRGPTYRSLMDTDRCYNFEGVGVTSSRYKHINYALIIVVNLWLN